MNFVSEWMTTSAPCSTGRTRMGVATVLSTMSGMACRCATSASASRSQTLPAGLPTVSQNTARVFSSISASMSAAWSDFANRTVHAEARQDMREQRVGRAVELRHGDDIAAHLRHVERRVVKRRLARADAERSHASLELRDALLEDGGGGVGDARVPESLDLEIEQRGAVRGAVEGVGGGLVDGHGHRFGGGIRVESPVNRDGLSLHARCLEERATV